jgi:hypothetical protein
MILLAIVDDFSSDSLNILFGLVDDFPWDSLYYFTYLGWSIILPVQSYIVEYGS